MHAEIICNPAHYLFLSKHFCYHVLSISKMLVDWNLAQIPLNIHTSGLVYSGNFEKGSQILTFTHICRFAVVKSTECTARFEIILVSANKHLAFVVMMQLRSDRGFPGKKFQSYSFPIFDYQPLKARCSLDICTLPDGATLVSI